MASRVTGHVRLVQRKRGPVWYLAYRLPDGRQVQKLLGGAWTERSRPPAGHFTKRMAMDELGLILADARRGTLAVSRTGATFADAAAEFLRWIEEDRERDPATIRDYRGVIDGYLLPRFGERDVASITAEEIEQYRDWLKTLTRKDGSRRVGNRVIVRHLVVLHAIFKRAMKVWGLSVNPASGDLVDRPRVEYDKANYRTLAPDHVRLVASRMEIPEESALVIVAAFTGLRLGELLALHWEDIDWGLRRIHVKRSLSQAGTEKTTKSGKSRSSILVDEVIAALDGLSRRPLFTAPGDLVFCSPLGEHLSGGMLRRRFYAALDACELPRVRLHDLRHSFGTLAVQAFPITDVQGYLGHAHLSTTMRYVHHSPAHDAAARLQAVLGEPCTQPCTQPPATERNGAALTGANSL